jgi:hypothetical protein
MKVAKLVHGQGVVKNTGNYESIRVYNEVEVTINKGDDIKKCHTKLREAVDKLNQQDLERILGE